MEPTPDPAARQPGVILFYLAEKGQGYLRLVGTAEEFFFTTRQLQCLSVRKGDLVTFIPREGRNGYFADAIMAAGLA